MLRHFKDEMVCFTRGRLEFNPCTIHTRAGRRVKRLLIFDVCNYYLLLAFVRCAELLDKLV